MNKINRLLLENQAWAQGKLQLDPDFFTNMAKDQKPDYLWIGCSDSRVDPNELTNTAPGEMFVHRNVANLVVHTDLNLLSVLQYAVEALGVEHVIVCGHYNCGGVRAALSPQSLGVIDHWIKNIKDTYATHKVEIDQIEKESDRVNKLVELNVIQQVKNIAHTSIIQHAWKKRQGYPILHGWVYDLAGGRLKPISTVNSADGIDHAHKYSF